MAHALRGGAARAWGADDTDGAVPTLTFGAPAPAPAPAAAPPALAGPGGHAMTRRSGGKEKAAKAKAAKALVTFEDGAVPDLVLTPGHVGGEHTNHHQLAGSTLFTDWLSGAEVTPLEGGEEFAVPDLARRAPAGGRGAGRRAQEGKGADTETFGMAFGNLDFPEVPQFDLTRQNDLGLSLDVRDVLLEADAHSFDPFKADFLASGAANQSFPAVPFGAPGHGAGAAVPRTPAPASAAAAGGAEAEEGPPVRYTGEARQRVLERFRQKRLRRQYGRRVRYHVRKQNAEKRPRYKGKFINLTDPMHPRNRAKALAEGKAPAES